jgi:acetoin utilization deacetylase AcuC-like enzyme
LSAVSLHYDPVQAQHDVRGHPEQPARVDAVFEELRRRGRLEGLLLAPPRSATTAELELIHTAQHVEQIARLDETGGGAIDPDTAVVSGSYAAARSAAGSLLAAVDQVAGGAAEASFCLVRPPGHHASCDRAMGFCLFNNVAIAAAYARKRHGLGRVAIVDFDVHHGNGTQDLFWDDPDVLYLSLHQYPFYPGSGDWREAGGPRAGGTTVNVPLPEGSGDVDYLRAFELLIEPLVVRFQPQLLLISAGYDAHRDDPLANMRLSTIGYGLMMARLRTLAARVCRGRLVAALEGGYNLGALADSVEASLVALVEPPAAVEQAAQAGPRVETYLAGLRRFHSLPVG